MAWPQSYSRLGKIQRVQPLLLRLEKKENDDFVPRVVSFGPYHHGKPELALVEAFKPTVVDMFVEDGPESRDFYYKVVLEIVEDIRSCYELESIPEYSDEESAEMMLCDAAAVIFIVQLSGLVRSRKYTEAAEEELAKFMYMKKHLGSLVFLNLIRDIHLLENQIPLFLIKLLVRLRYGAGEDDILLSRYFWGFPEESLLLEFEEEEPLHLLEVSYRLHFPGSSKPEKTITNPCRSRWLPCSGAEKDSDIETGGVSEGNNHHFSSIFASVGRLLACRKGVDENDPLKDIPVFRSATDLKAKGIYFKVCATSSRSLKDISFRTHSFYARLQPPQAHITYQTKVGWKNMIAYEVGPSSRANKGNMLSYVRFMKSLIQTTDDVKELREKKIILNNLEGDEEVLDLFNDINAHWMAASLFEEVNDQIQAHCRSRSKNWVAELVHANFQSPWKVIAFVAAVALLAISAAQLYYAVHPN